MDNKNLFQNIIYFINFTLILRKEIYEESEYPKCNQSISIPPNWSRNPHIHLYVCLSIGQGMAGQNLQTPKKQVFLFYIFL